MKSTPIIYSTDMVRAYLDGKKTMTRRTYGLEEINKKPDVWKYIEFKNGYAYFEHPTKFYPAHGYTGIKCPYGQVGDELWVKETFCQVCYKKDGIKDVCYKEDIETTEGSLCTDCKWSSSMFMYRWASRITQPIMGIGCERLQDITKDSMDIWNEGCPLPYEGTFSYQRDGLNWYKELWDKINGKKHPWEKNEWVWVIKYPKYKEIK